MNDPIANALNIATVEQETLPAPKSNTAIVAANVHTSDLGKIKSDLENLTEKGSKALDELLEVASLSQHPRAYEVVSTLLSTLGNLNKQIADVIKERDKDKASSNTGGPNAPTQVFVGSTAELAAFMETQRRGR